MKVYAAQEMVVFGVAEAVAEPTTDPASAAPVFALPIVIKGRNQVPYMKKM